MKEIRVVIIDDEAWTRDTIKRIGKWRELGCRIVGEASDGLSGLECIRQLDPHLIITDMKMPGLDGAQMLRELDELQNVRVVLEESGFALEEVSVIYEPSNTIELGTSEALQVMRLVEALEDLDDVQNVYSALEISDEALVALEGA